MPYGVYPAPDAGIRCWNDIMTFIRIKKGPQVLRCGPVIFKIILLLPALFQQCQSTETKQEHCRRLGNAGPYFNNKVLIILVPTR